MKRKKKVKLTKFAKVLIALIIILAILLVSIILIKGNDNGKGKSNKKDNNSYNENMNKDKNTNTDNNKNNDTDKEKPVAQEKNIFENEKYYLSKNLERYKNYYNNHKDLSKSEIITRINSNLDKTFYVDVAPADLTKGNLVLVNKFFYVDSNFEPENLVSMAGYGNGFLVKDAHDAWVELYNAAKADGMNLVITTSYRNFGFQSTLYYNYVNEDGQEAADTYSARPGYSEHHTGLAVDLTNAQSVKFGEFLNTDEYKWMQQNAYKYGFIQRYTEANQYITGYQAEEWHYRYVGKDVAKYIYENNITFEEYYAYFVDK